MQTKSEKLWQRAKKHIASGTQTYSKQAQRYVQGVYPAFIERGKGAFVFDSDNNAYLDYPCALGANLLGYANDYINDRVKARIDKGILFSLPNQLEIVLAEKLCKLFPSMQKVRFVKSGSEAVSAGIKIARAYTGLDDVISFGYHGWHDWSTPVTEQKLGSPNDGHIFKLEFNNLVQLEQLLRDNAVACVVIDPYVFTEPDKGYYDKLIKLSHKYKALVLFDEIVTGFRWQDWSVQNHYKINPDLSTFGKSMANGFPISVIGGKSKYMDMLDKGCFVSTTFGGELASIEGALATIEFCEKHMVQEHIFETGQLLQEGFNQSAQLFSLPCKCIGNPARLKFEFPSNMHKSVFWQECIKQEVLFGGATHTCYAHSMNLVEKTVSVIERVMKKMKPHWDSIGTLLEGKELEEVSTIAQVRK